MKNAIAYLRFSSLQQVHGDSFRRQQKMIAEWLSAHPDYFLNPVTYEDLGLSAFRGVHAARGAFSVFMEAVELGHILSGSVLLVESLDRLSREKIGDATERLRTILKAGIDVVTLSDGAHYTSDSLNDPFLVIKAVLIAQRANEESEIKSRRMQSAWAAKRKLAVDAGAVMTTRCPAWLTVRSDRSGFDINNELADTIRYIYMLRLKEYSYGKIRLILNQENRKNLKGVKGAWSSSSVDQLLNKKSVTGILVPSRYNTCKGIEELPGYYPAIIGADVFRDVQLMRTESESKLRSKDNPLYINLFRSVMICKSCGHHIVLSSLVEKKYGYYVCTMRREKRCTASAINREPVDKFLTLGLLHSLEYLIGESPRKVSIEDLLNRHVELSMRMNNILEAVEVAPDVKELTVRARDMAKQLREAETDIARFRSRPAIKSKALREFNLALWAERKECQAVVKHLVKQIVLDTGHKCCDIWLMNGIRILNYPLDRRTDAGSLVSAMMYMQDNMLIL